MIKLLQVLPSLYSPFLLQACQGFPLAEESLRCVVSQLKFDKNILTSFLSGVEQRREGKNETFVW